MNKQKISPYVLVLLSFLAIILIASFLLTLPISHTNGQWGDYWESLFMATSATCVTGFDCYKVGLVNEVTLFGQIVEAICMQVGGLGFLTVLVFFITLFRSKLSFRDRFFLSQAVSSSDIPHVVQYVRKILLVTLIIEVAGFLLGLPVFFNLYGNTWEAYWGSIFLSISSYNNSGLDLFGTTSFIREGNALLSGMDDWAYYYMLTYTAILIVVGGLSVLVVLDLIQFKKPKYWKASTKICILMTVILIVFGALILYLTEGFTGVKMSFVDALFLSISSRTAGFASFDPYDLTVAGRIVTWILMFIGGCPLGTASGIKVTTVFIIVLSIISFFRSKKTAAFNRYFSLNTCVKAMTVFIISLFIALIGYIVLSLFEANSNPYFSADRALYETISAFSTTGFTTGMTVNLTVGGKITCVVLMFIGRLGPMTILSIFAKNAHIEDKTHIKYVEADVLIG